MNYSFFTESNGDVKQKKMCYQIPVVLTSGDITDNSFFSAFLWQSLWGYKQLYLPSVAGPEI